MAKATPKPLCEVTIPIKTTNPNNNSQGVTLRGIYARARLKREQRETARRLTGLVLSPVARPLQTILASNAGKVIVTMTRIAPSNGLDEDDNLRSALKWIKDGIAESLGLKNDRDPRVVWRYAQRRGPQGEYAVNVHLALGVDDE